jgi:two-component system chemotaxis response regulator CheY
MEILIADDAAFMRMRLKKLLEEAGYTVLEAANGKEAIAVYQTHHPAMVLMDITMPELDGVAATRAICQSDPQARVVMVSALGQQAMVVSAIQAGAKDFIVKPYQPERVLGAVAKWTT